MKKIIVILAAVVMVLTGCKTKESLTQTITSKEEQKSEELRVKVDSVFVSQIVKDSIYLHDSILVMTKGDTVWKEKWHTKYVERIKHDTIWKERVRNDTIYKSLSLNESTSQRVDKSKGQIVLNIIRFMCFIIVLGLIVYVAVKRLRG